MYLLKRIGANLFDVLLYLVLVLLTSWIFMHFNIVDGEFEVDFPLWSSFLVAILLPIAVFSKTIGERIFRVKCIQVKQRSIRLSLMLKYSVVYCFLTMTVVILLNFIGDLVVYYTAFSISKFFILRVFIAILFTNALFFFLSLGRVSLFDKVFALNYGSVAISKWYLSKLAAGYIFVLTMMVGIVIDWKFHNLFPSKKVAERASFSEIKFPLDEFENCTVGGRIYYRLLLTDQLVTTSDRNSFIQDKYLLQRQLEAQINDEEACDPKKRYDLCEKLLGYCYGILSLQDTTSLVKQTKIELVHMRYITPFIGVASYYNYYFDDTAARYGIYGGFNWDTLTLYYIQTMKNINDSLTRFVVRTTGISLDSTSYYIEHKDTTNLFGRMTPWARDQWLSTELGPLIDRRILSIRPIPFDSVRAISNITYTEGYALYQLFGGPFYDTQEVGTIGMRNGLGLRSVR